VAFVGTITVWANETVPRLFLARGCIRPGDIELLSGDTIVGANITGR
jgi:hypothetical protein